jgi:hypothetical protein
MSAAREYKDVIAAVTAGYDAAEEGNAERLVVLRRRVEQLDRALRAAGDAHLLTRIGLELAWQDALDVLWGESWLDMRRFPAPEPPDGPVEPEDVRALSARVEELSAALRAEVQRRRLIPGT